MSLRENPLVEAGGSPKRTAALLAGRLMDGDPDVQNAGCTRENAIIAASELFDVRPEWLEPIAPTSAC